MGVVKPTRSVANGPRTSILLPKLAVEGVEGDYVASGIGKYISTMCQFFQHMAPRAYLLSLLSPYERLSGT